MSHKFHNVGTRVGVQAGPAAMFHNGPGTLVATQKTDCPVVVVDSEVNGLRGKPKGKPSDKGKFVMNQGTVIIGHQSF
jgi:hypothetical protein